MVKFLNLAKGFYNFPLCGEKIITIKLINVGRQAQLWLWNNQIKSREDNIARKLEHIEEQLNRVMR